MTQMKTQLVFAALLLSMPGLSGCSVSVTEQQLIRPVAAGPLAEADLTAAVEGYSLERHSIEASDGVRLEGVLLRRENATATLLYFGGNQFTVGRVGPAAARVLFPLGVNIMMVDHRGYGQSEGSPTPSNIMSDGLDIFDYLKSLPGMSGSRIVVHGQSLGSFVAGHVAAHRDTAGVVLESSVTTTEAWIKTRAGSAPVRVTVAPELAKQGNSRNMPKISEPLLILVGELDKVTPPALSRELFRLSPLPGDKKQIAVIEGAGHNDVLLKPQSIELYRAFLRRL